MRHPPPVSVRCCGGQPWRWGVALLHGLAAAALGAWLAGHAGWGPMAVLGSSLALLLTVTAAGVFWRPLQPVALTWDGTCWTADGEPGTVQVALDLGDWLLLRLQPAAPSGAGWRHRPRARWLPAAAAEAGPAWHALRVAAYAHDPAQRGADPAGHPHV